MIPTVQGTTFLYADNQATREFIQDFLTKSGLIQRGFSEKPDATKTFVIEMQTGLNYDTFKCKNGFKVNYFNNYKKWMESVVGTYLQQKLISAPVSTW